MASLASPRADSQIRHHQRAAMLTAGLDLGDLATNPILEGVLGPNKDGRVRNPVPSKLKGKTDNRDGKFAVMHLNMSPGRRPDAGSKDMAAERDAAARRTSENTASRAKAAQQDRYIPPKKRIEEGLRTAVASAREEQRRVARPLTPDETKYEQARLLTLLRSINPITVVDQLCKAVAYFGGIPGAPPPDDGIFPESANTRETGALFIGWLAEIFPDLTREDATAPPDHRANKGNARLLAQQGKPSPANGYSYGQAIPAPSWNLPQPLAMGPAAVHNHNQSTPVMAHMVQQVPPAEAAALSGPPGMETLSPDSDPSKKRRGRPKGSRNKGKGEDENGLHDPETSGMQTSGQVSNAPSMAVANGVSEGFGFATQAWQSGAGHHGVGSMPNMNQIDELSPEEKAVLEAFRNHGAQSLAAVGTLTSLATPGSPMVNASPQTASASMNHAVSQMRAQSTSQAGVKRKRPPAKAKSISIMTPSGTESVGRGESSTPVSASMAVSMAKEGLQWSTGDAVPAAPPAKKQRKPKTPNPAETPARRQTATPVVGPVSLPEAPSNTSQSGQQSQQSVSAPKFAADGLEAHYERFQQQQQQQQQQIARTNTPSTATQQIRHAQQKTNSVPMTQQGTAPAAQVAGRQERTVTPIVTPATSTYYTQRAPTSAYGSHYSASQSSQFSKPNQASPQSAHSNFTRAPASHSLPHASPQYPSSESTYRTTSPHSIHQPTTSYGASDSNSNSYRTPSGQNIAQNSTSYPSSENTYHSGSGHNLNQTAYSQVRPSTSQHQHASQSSSHSNPGSSNYNHFADSSYMDLPTLDSLAHASTQHAASNSLAMNASNSYGSGIGIGASRSATGSMYSTTSGLASVNSAFDASANELLRNARSASNANTYSSGIGLPGSYDASNEHLMRGLGRR